MALTTSLAGRVRNTSLPKSHALLPLHEAIVNGIQAIDARPDGIVGPGRIDVRVHRDPQAELDFGWAGPGRAPTKPIVGFTVTDDGVGFTARNVLSFETLDSDFKSDLGCRGVGRLLWLKAFDRVSVRSGYEDDQGESRERQFTFSVEREVEHEGGLNEFAHPGSVVRIDGFKKAFRLHAPKGVDDIAREVFLHCIWNLLRPGGAPVVTIADDDEALSLADLMDDFVARAGPRPARRHPLLHGVRHRTRRPRTCRLRVPAHPARRGRPVGRRGAPVTGSLPADRRHER